MIEEQMRWLTHMRMVAALAVLAAVLMPTALCFGAVTPSPHPCCIKQASAWQDGSGANNECCVVSAPAPNQAAVTSTDPGSKAAAPAVVAGQLSAPAVRQAIEAFPSAEHSPPDSASRAILRI
jgi:hypothetical protein